MRDILVVLLCLLVACPSDIALSIDVNGELKNALLEKQSSSPTGYEGRIYYNTTTKRPEIYNGTAWTSLGSGGEGFENWIENGKASEPVITGIRLYNDGGATPTDCDGGTPSAITDLKIENGEYVVEKGDSDAQGEGVAIDVTVPANTPSTTATLEIIQRVASGTYAAGDVGVYIYDVTNGGTPTKLFDLNNVTTDRVKADGLWVANSTSTSYRICLHVQTTSASAYDLALDDLYAGTEKHGAVPVMPYANCENWTPTGSWVANTTYSGVRCRLNDLLLIYVTISLSGEPTSADLTINLPPGLTMRSDIGITSFPVRLYDASTPGNRNSGTALLGPEDNIIAIRGLDTNTRVNATTPFTWASGDSIVFWAYMPIAEWTGPSYASPGSQCEYAYPTGTWDSATTTYAYGMTGAPMGGALSGTTTKKITFTRPVRFIRVLGSANGKVWGDLNSAILDGFRVVPSMNSEGNVFAGVGWRPGDNDYEVGVTFGRYMRIANDDSPALDWPSSNAFVLVENCPTAQGSIVYAMADLNTPGLVSNEHKISASNVSNSSGATGTLSWRIDVVGRVVNFYGFFNITGTTHDTSTFAAALPDGFRPPNDMYVFCRFNTSLQAIYLLSIGTTGNLVVNKRTFTAASGMATANFGNNSSENAIACSASWPKTGT